MSMREGIFLHNTCHVETDSFGNYSEQSPIIGFTNYGSEGNPYYSFDEVEELLKNGFVDDNISRDENGKLYLKCQYCSYSYSFNIVCGQVVTEICEKHKSLYDYCKKISLIKDKFTPVVGWFGTKEMSKNEDGTFNISYTFNNFDEKRYNINMAEKICIGSIKKLAGRRQKTYSKDGLIINKLFECKDLKFDNENKRLIIEGIPLQYINKDIVHVIVELDLELWMIFNDNKNWSRFFDAAIDVVRDMGQQHWFDNIKSIWMDEDKQSNKNWFNRRLGEEWIEKEENTNL